jgi:hypothetical protein
MLLLPWRIMALMSNKELGATLAFISATLAIAAALGADKPDAGHPVDF